MAYFSKGGGEVPHTAFGGLLFTGVVFFYYVFVSDTSTVVLCFLKAEYLRRVFYRNSMWTIFFASD